VVAMPNAHGEGGHHETGTEWLLMALSVGLACAGIFLAKTMFDKKRDGDAMEKSLGSGLHRLLYNKYFVDEIYGALFVNGFAKGGGTALWSFDAKVIDGGVNGAGWLTRMTSTVTMWWDTWVVDGAVRLTGFVIKLASYPMRMLQTGMVQSYAFFLVAGVLVILSYYLFQ